MMMLAPLLAKAIGGRGGVMGLIGGVGARKRRRRRSLTQGQKADIMFLATSVGKTAAANYVNLLKH